MRGSSIEGNILEGVTDRDDDKEVRLLLNSGGRNISENLGDSLGCVSSFHSLTRAK